ncbi:MAG: hypothetical protein ACTSQ8_17375 [Candidatus Helarchaeota archaeon]
MSLRCDFCLRDVEIVYNYTIKKVKLCPACRFLFYKDGRPRSLKLVDVPVDNGFTVRRIVPMFIAEMLKNKTISADAVIRKFPSYERIVSHTTNITANPYYTLGISMENIK